MRVQILPLPSVVVGEEFREPFGLIVDQCDTNAVDAGEWKRFAEECGARSILITPETVEVVDQYAETPPRDDQGQGEDAATREPNDIARPDEPWPAPCPDWIRAVEHPAHEWGAPVGGRASSPGWTPPAASAPEADHPDPEQPTPRQVIASALRGDWVFAEEPGHIERVADAILAALDEHGLDITRRGDAASGVTALAADGRGEISIYGRRRKILAWTTLEPGIITLHTAPLDTPPTRPGSGACGCC